MKIERVEISNSYLLIAPNPDGGYYHSLTEHAFLVDNILNFLQQHPSLKPHQVTVYELKQINEYVRQELSVRQ